MNPRASLPPYPASSSWTLQSPSDPELAALPSPPKRQRTLAAVLMLLTSAVSLAMCWAVHSEALYAFARSTPLDIGQLVTFSPGAVPGNSYVEAQGLLGTTGAIRYARPFEGDSFRLQPVAGNARLWVEIRVPEGMEGPRFVPPTSFAGRLVPFSQAGIRHKGLIAAVQRESHLSIAKDSWVLVDGASPRASRWAVALSALFGFFALWTLANTFRILRRVR